MSDTVIKEQEPAPDFTLPAVGSDDVVKNGHVHLADLRGKTVVLYFYPLDERTPVKFTFSLAQENDQPDTETAVTVHHFSLA